MFMRCLCDVYAMFMRCLCDVYVMFMRCFCHYYAQFESTIDNIMSVSLILLSLFSIKQTPFIINGYLFIKYMLTTNIQFELGEIQSNDNQYHNRITTASTQGLDAMNT